MIVGTPSSQCPHFCTYFLQSSSYFLFKEWMTWSAPSGGAGISVSFIWFRSLLRTYISMYASLDEISLAKWWVKMESDNRTVRDSRWLGDFRWTSERKYEIKKICSKAAAPYLESFSSSLTILCFFLEERLVWPLVRENFISTKSI